MKNYFEQMLSYHSLGYDVYLTSIHGKDGVKMVKRYSYKAMTSLICEQIIDHDNLADMDYLNNTLDFLYKDIQKQEETGNYYQPF